MCGRRLRCGFLFLPSPLLALQASWFPNLFYSSKDKENRRASENVSLGLLLFRLFTGLGWNVN